MIQLAGYQVEDQLYHGQRCRVYRARDITSQKAVIIKTASSELPSTTDLTELKHDYEIGQQFNDTHIVRYLDLKPYEHNLALILENFDAVSLEEYLANQVLSLSLFLKIAIQLVESLMLIHDKNIIHKDIKPLNILINPNSNKIKITGFGLASKLQHETQQVVSPGQLEGTLPYISPEQTGRMNRSIDYRTDFYSMGITFYKMLTGNLPFSANDAMELVHCHIAKSPKPPKMIGVDVPEPLSELILTLLAKNSEDRYQSARGILADLEKIYSMLQTKDHISTFKLGQRDVSGIFQIPQKLYGREKELDTLMASFERVSDGPVEMMLVAGYSGIGKSSLVQEIHRPIVGKHGYFISGKFDQFKRNEPYYALILAFQELIKHLLTETESQLLQWKEKLLGALGINGQVIIDVIPEVELVMGLQPTITQLGPAEAQNRFNMVFENFIKVFTQKEHPLVVFIDDLQWADAPSLNLVKVMMTDPYMTNLLLIGAYRDNEVDPSHPFMLAVEQLIKEGATLSTITLPPLKSQDLVQLVADTLKTNTKKVAELSQLVMEKTNGNPFFVNEFCKNLYQEHLLSFNAETESWGWDIQEINKQELTENVVELMMGKIRKLPEETQDTLKLGACIGASFDLKTLSVICERPLIQVAKSLWPAVEHGIILPLNEEHKLLKDLHDETGQSSKLLNQSEMTDCGMQAEDRFQHDRVQQAAYSLIPINELKPIHLKIGQLLLASADEEILDDKLFYIVEQLNAARELMLAENERVELATLNLKACIKAKDSTAFGPAAGHAEIGIELLGNDAWKNHYALAFELSKLCAESLFLIGNIEASDLKIRLMLKQVANDLDKSDVYQLQMVQLSNQGNYAGVFDSGIKALALFGISFPDLASPKALKKEFEAEYKLFQKQMEGKGIKDLINLPIMSNAKQQACTEIMAIMIDPAFFANPNFLSLLVTRGVRYSINHGNSDISTFIYGWFATIMGSVLNDYPAAYEFGDMALKLNDKVFHNKKLSCKLLGMFAFFVYHWKKPLHGTVSYMQQAIKDGMETGDIIWTTYSLQVMVRVLYSDGSPLQEALDAGKQSLSYCQKVKQHSIYELQLMVNHAILNMQGKTQSRHSFNTDHFDEAICLARCEKMEFYLTLAIYNFYKLKNLCIFGKYEQAAGFGQKSQLTIVYFPGCIHVAEHYFYYAIALLGCLPNLPKQKQQTIWDQLASTEPLMKNWADNCPSNFLDKYQLIQAEKARCKGNPNQAMGLYQQAIESAKMNGYTHWEAMANELCGRFWLDMKQKPVAVVYIREAHYLFGRWGANAKVAALEEQYSILLSDISARTVQGGSLQSEQMESNTLSRQISDNLDLTTVLKASQTISGEIDLAKLLGRLMTIIIENAGARFGHLILEHEGTLLIEASAQAEHKEIEVLQSTSLDKNETLAMDVVRYVENSGEDVILKNAFTEGMFTTSPYIIKKKSKSILCIPIKHQNKLQGLLYLENNEMDGAFTEERVELLRVLLSQAAISIENATLYATLEDKVKERTQELRDTMNQLIEAEKMVALGQLVAGVAHEINTPVGISVTSTSLLQGLTQQLKDKYQNGSMTKNDFEDYLSKSREIADLVLNNMNKAASLVARFKTTAVNQSEEQKQRFKLKHYLEEILSSLSVQLRENHHRVTVNCDSKLELEGYPIAFALVISNLVVNSIIHGFKAREGGQIMINVNDHSNKEADSENIQIEYHDDGVGISEEDLKKVFEPFFTTNMGSSTGLGLHIVYNIITQQFGGAVYCENSRGKSETNTGAHFIITLP